MAALVWTAVDQFGIPWDEIIDLFLATLMVIGLIILAAAVFVGLLMGLRKLLGGGR